MTTIPAAQPVTQPPAEPVTVRAFLFGEDGPDSTGALVGPLRAQGVTGALAGGLRGLTPAADRAVEEELAAVLDGFLGLDLLDLAAGGWRRHAALTAAARRTRDTPGSQEVVAMATHRITSSHRPHVDVFVDSAQIGTLDVALTMVYRISGLVVVVRDAHLVAVRSGECAIEGTLSVQRVVLAERKGRLNLPGILRLRSPIPLLREPPPAVPPPPEYRPTVARGNRWA